MLLQEKVRSILYNFEFCKENRVLLDDSAKYTVVIAKMLINLVNIWPVNVTISKRLCFFVMFFIGFSHELSLLGSLIVNAEDVDVFTQILSSTIPGLQVVVKATVLYYYSQELSLLFRLVKEEFWPSNLVGNHSEDHIKNDSKQVLILVFIEYSVALVSHFGFVIMPMIKHARLLPFNSWYPFDWTQTPLYEILYATQIYMALYVDLFVVAGFDALYCTLCSNCVAQFRLLCEVIKQVGSGDEHKITEELLKIPGVVYRRGRTREDQKERELLVICIKHHQKLIHVCNELNKVFGNGHFVQLVASLIGICTNCYQTAQATDFNTLLILFVLYIAYLCQLFIYCLVSNELSYWSTRFSSAAFESMWYNGKYTDIRRCLSIVIIRSQKEESMNAFGLFQLNYPSFITVVRFSFSLYTFLTKMAM